ncbi:MAG: hypothetical protein MZW92_02560 [Comamonadaceae bacterium]|nr:hypothetical protein [Comamonadaceae bacterium]
MRSGDAGRRHLFRRRRDDRRRLSSVRQGSWRCSTPMKSAPPTPPTGA